MLNVYGNQRIQMDLPESLSDKLIKDILATHENADGFRKRYINLHNYFKGSFEVRTNATADMFDNKIKNDYAGYIVDTIHGYWLGKPVNYTSVNDAYMSAIQNIYDLNNEPYHNSVVGKKMGIQGESFEILYTNENADVRFTKVPAEEMLVIYNNALEAEPVLGFRYYTVNDLLKNTSFKKIEMYWKDRVQYFTQVEGNFNLDLEVPHYFGDVPIVHFENNEEHLGDFEKVLTQINEYSTRVSNNANELDYMREAYLKLVNVNADPNVIKELGKKGIIALNDGGDAEFLIKNLQDTFNKNHLDRINKDIHKYSKVPDLSDENFAGNLSGVAIEYKLWGLEQIAVQKEAMFRKALKRRLRLITNILNLKGNNYDWRDIEITFTRNMPVNTLEEVDKAIKAQQLGLLSDEKIVSMLPFVEDPAYELEKRKQQLAEQTQETQVNPDNPEDTSEQSEGNL